MSSKSFIELIDEIFKIIDNYNEQKNEMGRSAIQDSRDTLSVLVVHLADVDASLYGDSVGAEFSRRIGEERNVEFAFNEMGSKATSTVATRKGKIASQNLYDDERKTKELHRRAQNIFMTAQKVLDSMASRLQSFKN